MHVGSLLAEGVGDDGEADALLLDGGFELVEGLDGEGAVFFADLGGVGVEDGGEAEAFFFEAAVGEECSAEVAGADEEDVPGLVGAEDSLDLPDEIVSTARSSMFVNRVIRS